MNQSSAEFWQHHSVRFLEMVFRADRRETLSNADGCGKKTRECGDTMEIYLVVRNGRVQSASFECNGCLYAVACVNAAVNLVEGMSLDEAWKLSPQMVVDYLESLPPEETHCAEQAIETLRLALADARESERQPWKKLYRRK
jgi:nitrogen fixation protein NifU and related proteins